VPPAHPSRNWAVIGLIVAVVAAGLLVVLAGGLYVADQFVRAQEYAQFQSATTRAEDVMEVAGARYDEIVKETGTSNTTPEGFIAQWKKFGAVAEEASVDLAVVQAEMSRQSALPWHTAMDRAREDYLAHIDAWMDEYADFARKGLDPDYTFDNGTLINQTWAIAQVSSKDAIPTLFSGGFADWQAQEFGN
jgi:hypothetical protein